MVDTYCVYLKLIKFNNQILSVDQNEFLLQLSKDWSILLQLIGQNIFLVLLVTYVDPVTLRPCVR